MESHWDPSTDRGSMNVASVDTFWLWSHVLATQGGCGPSLRPPQFTPLAQDLRQSTDGGFVTHPCVFQGRITKAISLDSALAYICITRFYWLMVQSLPEKLNISQLLTPATEPNWGEAWPSLQLLPTHYPLRGPDNDLHRHSDSEWGDCTSRHYSYLELLLPCGVLCRSKTEICLP